MPPVSGTRGGGNSDDQAGVASRSEAPPDLEKVMSSDPCGGEGEWRAMRRRRRGSWMAQWRRPRWLDGLVKVHAAVRWCHELRNGRLGDEEEKYVRFFRWTMRGSRP